MWWILDIELSILPACRYHQWMKSEELQKLTASEPLTLEQEYDMQESWSQDENKCTFIILDLNVYSTCKDEIESMIGDTNIFISGTTPECVGEIEIMIAEIPYRGKKCGWEAVILMLLYGIHFIELKRYEAKISDDNEASIRMFKKLGFVEKSRSEVFKEVSFEKDVDEAWKQWLENEVHYDISEHI